MPVGTYQSYSKKATPQSEPIPGREKDMVENNAGGIVFKVDCWAQMQRFLILGTEGGTYYVGERELTRENAQNVMACLQADHKRAIEMIVEISLAGRAPKNDPALFALALAASDANRDCRKYALSKLPDVARIGTHLFHFAGFCDTLRGWGRGLREAVAKWYLDLSAEHLSFQLTKYQSRDGWSHRDMLRLAHPKAKRGHQQNLLQWAVGKHKKAKLPGLVGCLELMKTANEKEIISLIKEHKAPREVIPTEYQSVPDVQRALIPFMGIGALIRNLGRFGKSGLLKQGAFQAIYPIVERLSDPKAVQKSRVHPIQVLAALLTYSQGHGMRGKGSWEVVPQIKDILDRLFYMSFGNVESTGQRFYLGIDVSGSMTAEIQAIPGLSARVAAAAMAMVTVRTEPKHIIKGFHGSQGSIREGFFSRRKPVMIDLKISAGDPLDTVKRKVHDSDFGATDCALPMLDALEQKIEVDCFVIYTDNETWCGDIHPTQALQNYRQKMGINARLIVVAMTSTGFSIADPADAGMLDVVGFDTATPNLIASFSHD